MRESVVEKHLVKECDARRWLCWKFSSPGLRGVPDRIVITTTGRIYFVELKSSRGTLSTSQLGRKWELQDRKCTVVYLYSIDDIDGFMRRALHG